MLLKLEYFKYMVSIYINVEYFHNNIFDDDSQQFNIVLVWVKYDTTYYLNL